MRYKIFESLADWGRMGGNLSTTNTSHGGYDASNWCSNPKFGFATDDFDGTGFKISTHAWRSGTDLGCMGARLIVRQCQILSATCDPCPETIRISGGVDQSFAAVAMNKACGSSGCQFIVSTGDNFYGARCPAYSEHAVRREQQMAHLSKNDLPVLVRPEIMSYRHSCADALDFVVSKMPFLVYLHECRVWPRQPNPLGDRLEEYLPERQDEVFAAPQVVRSGL